jgi:hypothetical protein
MRKRTGIVGALVVALGLSGIGAIPTAGAATATTLIPQGSVWKYTDDGVNRGTVWKDEPYDDSTWKSGSAQLGYGDGDETTAMNNGGSVPSQRFISHYLRKSFTATAVNQISGLELSVLRDDGVVVYLNGVEVVRDNMPAGTITNTTFAVNAQFDAAETTYHDFAIPPAYLREGTNVLAVSLHNESRQGAGDISFDAVLTASTAGAPAPTHLFGTGITYKSVGLGWNTAPDAVSYRVFRDGAPIGTSTTTSFTDTSIALGRQYVYTVSSVNVEGDESAPSNPYFASTPSPTLIDTRSTWKYTDDGVNRGTAWKETAYNDTAWKSGRGQLGYGDGDELTVMNNGGSVPSTRWISHYLRRSFDVSSAASISSLKLSVLRDDGVVVYLNGVEVVRDNMPAGTITNTTFAVNAQFDAAESTYYDFTIPASALREGTNVLAVSVHNESRQGAGDLSFDARLTVP